LSISTDGAETGLSLVEAIELAIDHNYRLKAVQHDSAVAAIKLSEARTGKYPVLSIKAQSFFIDDLQSIDLPLGSIDIGSRENYQAEVTVSMPFYSGGRISGQIALAGDNKLAESSRLVAQRSTVAYQCRMAYLSLMASDARVKAVSSSLERVNIISKDVQNLHQGGLADSLDILDAALALEKSRNLLEQQKAGFRNASIALAQLIGAESGETIEPTDSVPSLDPPEYANDKLGETISRAELERFDHLISAADRMTYIETSSYKPTISGFAGYSLGKPNRDLFQKSWNDYFSMGITLNWDLNLGGKNSRTIQSAKRAALSMRMARKALHDDLTLQQETAINNLKLAYTSSQFTKKELEIASQKYTLARQQRDEGQISVNRLLEMEAELTEVEQQYQVSIIQYYLAENEYLYAIGSAGIFGGLK
jgi:outer membrane protein TolC